MTSGCATRMAGRRFFFEETARAGGLTPDTAGTGPGPDLETEKLHVERWHGGTGSGKSTGRKPRADGLTGR